MGLDSVELIVNVENKFQIQIPDLEAEEIETVRQLVKSIKGKTELELSNEEVFHIVCEMIFTQVGFSIDRIKYDSKIAYDLGFD